MKISYNWLKEFVNIDFTPKELSELLTNCGLEVEELEHWQSIKGGLDGIVVGKVIEKQKHLNADKLSVTKVDIGDDNPINIVCGAPNVESGQLVTVALIGSKLYADDNVFEIKQTKIRGVDSYGMICSEKELGIGNSHDGILVLNSDAKVGQLAKEYFKVQEDWIFTIGITPNRVDATSHLGVAIDVLAVTNASNINQITLKDLNYKLPQIKNIDKKIEVIIEDKEACHRYSGLTFKNVKVKDSPKWLVERLSSLGIRPINNIVDITNYVMLALGQPLHAFDLQKVKNNKIVVKKFDADFDFLCLDEKTRKITKDDLMICNSDEAMCIAGVYGGFDSGVSKTTNSIFLESAYFNPQNIRKTSNRHELKTDSSFRFERGADISKTITALEMAAALICELAEAEISSDVIDIYPNITKKHVININYDFVSNIIGFSIPIDIQNKILKDLGFEILEQTQSYVIVEAPLSKVDVIRDIDVVEEILRIYGYNKIPEPQGLKTNITSLSKINNHKTKNLISELLVSKGFFEIMTNSLSPSEYYSSNFGFAESDVVQVINPLSRELNTLRPSMVFSGIQAITYNLNRKQSNLKFFDFGKIYKQLSNDKNLEVTNRFFEQNCLSIYCCGNIHDQNWKTSEQKVDFFFIKQIFNSIILRLGIKIDNIIAREIEEEIFEYGLSFYNKAEDNKEIAKLGLVSKKVTEKLDCKTEVFFAEIYFDKLQEILQTSNIQTIEVSKFPEVKRDIALLLNRETAYQTVRDIVVKNSNSKLVNLSLFDVYQGDKIPSDKKSYAISLVLQDKEKTLTDAETDAIVSQIKQQLVKKLDAVIR